MNTLNLIAQDLFDKVRSRFFNLELGNSSGSVTTKPEEARFFDFDFIIEGNKLGRISISINDQASLKIFYSQNLLENADADLIDMWYDFLREMRFFAKRRMLKFDTRDITKSNLDKTDFQYLASKGKKDETVQESMMFGSTKSSYFPLENTKLIIRHTKKVDEDQRGSRSRNIQAIYVENKEGERFRCPYNSLSLGKAMQRHVANGGNPYDSVGGSIIHIAEQISQLLKFKRHIGNKDNLSEDVSDIVNKCSLKLESLRKELRSLSKQSFYESWKSKEKAIDKTTLDKSTLEDYKSKFTINLFNEELEQYFPLVHAIMQETSEIDLEEYINTTSSNNSDIKTKKMSIEMQFENWINSIDNSKLSDDNIRDLKKLLDNNLTIGVNAINAIESLENIGINDVELFNQLEKIAKNDVDNADTMPAEPAIKLWLETYDYDAFTELTAQDKSKEETKIDNDQKTSPSEKDIEDTSDQELEKIKKSLKNTSPVSESKKNIDDKIEEMILSFYNRSNKNFPLGETGVITKITKEFGEKFEPIIKKKVYRLSKNHL